jgi:hypothetical protein
MKGIRNRFYKFNLSLLSLASLLILFLCKLYASLANNFLRNLENYFLSRASTLFALSEFPVAR